MRVNSFGIQCRQGFQHVRPRGTAQSPAVKSRLRTCGAPAMGHSPAMHCKTNCS